ncbi:unnamed protein product, partial [Hapterophycus canaliculatus]
MSAGLYERQMAWKKFISKRSDEQARAILADACRRRPLNHQDDDSLRPEAERRSNPLRSSTSSTSSSTSSNGNNSNIRRSRGSTISSGRCNNKAATALGRAHARCHPQHNQRNMPYQPSPAPSYSNMLSARRTAAAATTKATAPSEARGGKREESGSTSARAVSVAKRYPPAPVRSTSLSRQPVGDNGVLEAVVEPTVSPSNTAAATEDTHTAAAAAEGATAPAAAATLCVTATAGVAVSPPPPPQGRLATPTASRTGSDGRDGDGTRRNAREAVARKSIDGRNARKHHRQGGTMLRASDPEHECRGHHASGNTVVSTDTTLTAAVDPAAPAPAPAADAAKGKPVRGDNERASRGVQVFGNKPLGAGFAEGLMRKEQAWTRERAQLLTVIKLQHKQLLRSSETRVCSSPSASCSSNAAKCNGSGATPTATASSTATTASAEPDRPRSRSRGQTHAPPSRLHTPPAAAAAAAKGRIAPVIPKTSMATEDGDRSEAFGFSTSERSRLLGKVELQREEAARARRPGPGGGRGPGGTGHVVATGAAAGAMATSRTSTVVSATSETASPESDGGHGAGSARDDRSGGSGRGGGQGGKAGRGARGREARGGGGGGRGDADGVMERNIEAILGRLSELEKRKGK